MIKLLSEPGTSGSLKKKKILKGIFFYDMISVKIKYSPKSKWFIIAKKREKKGSLKQKCFAQPSSLNLNEKTLQVPDWTLYVFWSVNFKVLTVQIENSSLLCW